MRRRVTNPELLLGSVTSNKKNLRLGLVGRGRWGRNIERTLRSFPDVTVLAIPRGGCDPRELDGVVVASPSATHAAVALPYIEYGLPTFIEKPMATSVAEAEALRDAAERSGAPIFVGHLQLYNPAFRKALETLPALGAVRYLLFEGMDSNPRADSSVLWDWLPHHLSMARAIFGLDATSIQAWSLAGGNSPQAAMSRFLFGATPVASVTSWLSPVRRRLMTAVCERGTLVFDDRAERKLVVYEALGGRMGGELHALQLTTAVPN